MSYRSRFINTFRRDRVLAEIDEELQAHLDEAAQHGRDSADLRREFGSTLRLREQSADLRLTGWLDSVRADVIFASRQIRKNPAISATAILSLGLAMGACASAFRIIDALLLRPLPVRDPGSLSVLTYPFRDGTGNTNSGEWFDYPQFRFLLSNATDVANLTAISMPQPHDLQLTRGGHGERSFMQYVSGWMFQNFGLQPAAGRLLTPADDRVPGRDAVAVLSYDYWSRRFARDPAVVGRQFFYSTDVYQIIGVAPRGFTGTDPGAVTDVFVPTMMNRQAIDNPHWGWFRIWVRPRPGTPMEAVRQKLQAALYAWRLRDAKQFPSPANAAEAAALHDYLNARASLAPAAAGFSGLQNDYRRALFALAALVVALLLIACANMANMMTARAAARAREMALRVSIGAGRARLISLVITESLLIGLAACALGIVFAWWSAPVIVSSISPPDEPIRLILPADLRFYLVLHRHDAWSDAAVRLDAGSARFRSKADEHVAR